MSKGKRETCFLVASGALLVLAGVRDLVFPNLLVIHPHNGSAANGIFTIGAGLLFLIGAYLKAKTLHGPVFGTKAKPLLPDRKNCGKVDGAKG